jgi:hypothetical protein
MRDQYLCPVAPTTIIHAAAAAASTNRVGMLEVAAVFTD